MIRATAETLGELCRLSLLIAALLFALVIGAAALSPSALTIN